MPSNRQPLNPASPKRQRGAIGLFGALVLGLAVLFTALSVDSGRLMLEQRRLQKVADMAALDASSSAGGCGDGTLTTARTAAQSSAVRNGYAGDLGAAVGGVVLGDVRTGADGIRTFQPTAAAAAPSAVQVTAGSRVPASLLAGGIFGGTVVLGAVAVAEREALAGLSGGSFLARLDTTNSPVLNKLLGGILGSNLSLDLVSYQGIAATKINLLNLLAAQADVGTVDELLAADLTLGELLSLTATAVSDSGTASVAVESALGQIASAAVSNLHVQLGDVIGLESPASGAAAEAQISVLDLITTAALIANGQNAIALPLQVSLPDLTVTSNLRVIEPPQIAIGPPGWDQNGEWRTQMKTTQFQLDTTVTGNIPLELLSAQVNLNLAFQLAPGSAWLESIDCGGLGEPSQVTVGAQPGIASLRITQSPTNSQPGRIRVTLGGIIPVPPVDVNARLNLPLQDPRSTDLVYTVQHVGTSDMPQTQTASSPLAGSVGNGLEHLADYVVLDVGGIPVSGTLQTVLGNLLATILSKIASGLLDPVLTLLGVKAGGLDVQLFELKEERPELRI